MSEAAKMRMERIERLLSELEYEIVRGVMEREIQPDLHMSKIMPFAGGEAALEVHLYPIGKHNYVNQCRTKLRIVE